MTVPDRWRMLLVLFLARTSMACQFQTVPSDGPFLVDHLGIGFAQLGSLIGLYMLPGILIALPGGMLAQRFGAERVVLSGLALMVFGGALMGVDSVPLVFAGRLISGLGAVFINVLMTKMVTDWFAGREIVAAMALFVASWPLGIALGLLSFPPLAAAHGWPVVMQAGAVVVALCFAVMWLVYRPPPDAPAEFGHGLQIDLSRREWLLISLAGFIWGVFNAGYVILISFLPELFVQRGYSLPEASRVVSVLAWAVIFTVPLAGYLAEHIKRPNLIMIGGFLTVAAGAAALSLAAAPIIPFAVVALMVGLPAGLIMSLPAQAVRRENRSIGMGVFYTWHFAAMAVLPVLAGTARDLSASAAAPSLFAAVTMVAAALALIAFRMAQARVN
jgi:cyanate permease